MQLKTGREIPRNIPPEIGMPFCGYDPLMGVGLGRFAEGLSKSMAERAERIGLELPAQLSEEKDELFILAHFMERELQNMTETDPRRRRLEAFLGVAYLARYLMALNEPVPSERSGFDDRLNRSAVALDQLMFRFERAFENSPREWSTLDRVVLAYQGTFAPPCEDDHALNSIMTGPLPLKATVA